ncbi:hypothetical protein BDF14DRAFT_1885193 [Spinellus fusiger]|nr:hypothetical protein BDF14DRAFT_1885193 [Spinellus fusiger]
MSAQTPTKATNTDNTIDATVAKESHEPDANTATKVEDDNEDEPVEKGAKGEASKDMKNVTGYVNEELANRQVDAGKLANSLAFVQEAAKSFKQKIVSKPSSGLALNKQDIDLLVNEMQISRTEAEKVLRDNGDVVKALNELIEK